MIIANKFKSMKQAERFQERLYRIYDSVKLIAFPMFSEDGMYRWEVSE